MIRTERLTKSYGYHDALRELDLEVRRGEFLVLFGPNGAGKTTLLKLLAGLVRPTSGRVALGEGDDGRTRIGYVSHATFLYNRLTGRENLTYYARLYDVPDVDRRVEELGARVRLADRLDDPVHAYSRGMRQRLSIARALVNDPEVLLLDEPFTGLDPAAGDRLADQLASWATEGRAAVMVSHELQRGLALATRVAILDRGRFVLESPATTIDPTEFADTYRQCLRAGEA